MTPLKNTFQYGHHTVTLETGEVARQADGAVLVNMSDTVVLVTAVAAREADPQRGFFPLTVNYQERSYAAGRIPGGFFRREGRPSEMETLIARLIDRPLRPLFPAGFTNEVQIIATVLSLNGEVDPDVPAMLGASAALALTELFSSLADCISASRAPELPSSPKASAAELLTVQSGSLKARINGSRARSSLSHPSAFADSDRTEAFSSFRAWISGSTALLSPISPRVMAALARSMIFSPWRTGMT